MAENAEVVEPETTGTAGTAPEVAEGQAGGSPPAATEPTSASTETPAEKALRRKLTELGEQNAKLSTILNAAMQTDEWKAVDARLSGATPDKEAEDLDAEVFGENVATGKKWRERVKKEIRDEILREMTPVVREVGATKQEKDIERALKAEGIARTPDFDTFREDFEAENPSYSKLYSLDPKAATKWLASSYSLKVKRDGRTPVGDSENATLDRGGGTSARVGSAASQVKIARNDPDKLNKLFEAIKKGEQPVDEAGRPYKLPGSK